MTIYLSSFKRFGFRRSEILPFLRNAGIDIAATLEDIQNSAAQSAHQAPSAAPFSQPTWQELVPHWSRLTVDQCALVMLNENPVSDFPFDWFDGNNAFHTWRRVIEDACTAYDNLDAQNERGVWFITPQALMEWCNRNSFKCPLEPVANPRTTNGADRTDTDRIEMERLRARVEELEASAPQYLDPGHPRFSSKLAAAVRVWLAISAPKDGRTVKQTVTDWLMGNYAGLDLLNPDGQVNKTAIEQVAAVANWEPKGGAPKTPARESTP